MLDNKGGFITTEDQLCVTWKESSLVRVDLYMNACVPLRHDYGSLLMAWLMAWLWVITNGINRSIQAIEWLSEWKKPQIVLMSVHAVVDRGLQRPVKTTIYTNSTCRNDSRGQQNRLGRLEGLATEPFVQREFIASWDLSICLADVLLRTQFSEIVIDWHVFSGHKSVRTGDISNGEL